MAYRIGTRGSALATTQTQWAADAMSNDNAAFEQVIITTEKVMSPPDRWLTSVAPGSLPRAGAQAVINREVDMAVHSLKDLPAKQPPELRIAAIPERADVRDALCASNGLTLDTLPPRRSGGYRLSAPRWSTLGIAA